MNKNISEGRLYCLLILFAYIIFNFFSCSPSENHYIPIESEKEGSSNTPVLFVTVANSVLLFDSVKNDTAFVKENFLKMFSGQKKILVHVEGSSYELK